MTGSLALFQRIFQYLDMPAEVEQRPNAVELPRVRGSIAFEGVSFAYPQSRRPAASSIRSLPTSRRCPPDRLHDLPAQLEVFLDAVDHALRVRRQPFRGCLPRGEEGAQCADLGPNVIDLVGPDKGHHCA